MTPTPKQLKAWRARENLTLKQAAEVCGIKNFSRHVSGPSPNPQPLPAPNWFRACAYSTLTDLEWAKVEITQSALADYPELDGLSIGILTAIAVSRRYPSKVAIIREEMKK